MADLTVIKKQVIDLLNAGTYTAGVRTYSATSGDEDFLDEAIARAITEAKYIAGEKVCAAEDSTLKSAFLIADQAITHGAMIPTHYGNILNVKITPFSGATFTIRGARRSAAQIDAYRDNVNSMYDSVAHNAADTGLGATVPSSLAGLYSEENNLFEFTGFSATISYYDFTSTDLANYPASLEVPITHLAVGLLGKDGTVSEKFSEHLNIGLMLLGETVNKK